MKEISPADESGRETGLPQPWSGPRPTAYSGQGQVRACTVWRGLEKAPAHPGVWGFKGPWVLNLECGTGGGKREQRPKPCPGASGLTCQEEGFGGAESDNSQASSRMEMHDTQVPCPLPPPALSGHSLLTHSAPATLASFLFLETQQAHPPPQGPCTCCSLCVEHSSPHHSQDLSSFRSLIKCHLLWEASNW